METPRSGGRLILVCGLPGAGKTTYARQLQTRLLAIRFCPDEWMQTLSLDIWDAAMRERIENLQWQLAQDILVEGLTAVIEWGTWTRVGRDRLRLRARELGASVELHYLYAPVDLLFERLQRRAMERPPIRQEQLLQWAASFQAPTADEQALFDRSVELPAPSI